ncbi:MAG: aldo/keto reductase [Candidatus Eisenbacteria bacterium]
MKYRLLGASGLRVSEICLGTMTFGEEWGWGASKEESRRIFETFTKQGGNFIDTANRYTEGTSEKWLGELVAAERERIVLATKYTLSVRFDDPNGSGNHRKNLFRSLDASLRRLGTEYIDLYWLHAWDYLTPIDEVMRALDDVVRAGKVLYVGVSDTPAWIVSRANTLASLRGWSPFVALQVEYSLIERTPERELLPMARALDLAVTPWAPLGAGLLTGKFTRGKPAGETRLKPESGRLSERNLGVARELDAVAGAIERPPAQVALCWLRRRPGNIIPIVGARTAAQLEESLGCLEFELGDDEVRRLDEASRIPLGFPHDFLSGDYVRRLVLGDKRGDIESHRGEWLP